MRLGKFVCGCIGTREQVIVDPCDSDGVRPLGFFDHREMREPDNWQPISEEENKDYIKRLAELIRDGYSLREIKALLREGL